MKRSHLVTTCVLSGGVLLTAMHHGDVHRDSYRSAAECRADWGNSAEFCKESPSSSGGSGGYGRYYGPSYENGARPVTRAPDLVESRQLVQRSGFGFSGARYSAGG